MIIRTNKQKQITNSSFPIRDRRCFISRNLKQLCSFGLLILAVMTFSACSSKATKNADSTKETTQKNAQETPAPTPTGTPSVFASMADRVDPLTITGKCGENAEWSYNTQSQKLIISGTGVVDQIIPLSGQYITDSQAKAKYRVKEIKIEEGITALDGGAIFLHTCKAKGMKEIKISLPDSLEKIGADTFDPGQFSCMYFRHIHLPKNVRYIKGGAFWGLGDEASPNAYSYQEDVKELSKRHKKS